MPHFSLLPGTKLYADTITEETIANAKHKDDFRMLIRPEKEMKNSEDGTRFNMLHIFAGRNIQNVFSPEPEREDDSVEDISYCAALVLRHARKFGIAEI